MRVPRFAAVTAGLIVTVGLTLSGCTPEAPKAEIITVNGVEPQYPLIPANTADAAGARIVNALFSGLVTYDETGAPVEDRAESVEHDETNKVYTVKLVDDATFSDGEALTSSSFVNAWDWAARFSNQTVDRQQFSDILGYEAEKDSSLLEAGGLVVLDDSTFEIHLKSAQSDFVRRLGAPAFAPLPTAFYADPEAFGDAPIGNGPYIFDGADAWQHGKRLELVVNPAYEGVREPANDGITMRFYDSDEIAYSDVLAGDLDVLDRLPAAAQQTYKEELPRRWVDHPIATLESIVIPAGLPRFSGPEGVLRRAAISLAIDRQTIIDEHLGGAAVPAQDFTSPALDTWAESLPGSEVLTFNEDSATERWAKADLLVPWEGTFQIAYNADGGHQEWVDAVAASISKVLGIEAVGVPYPSLAEVQAAVADGTAAAAFRSNLRADYPGVRDFIVPTYSSKGLENLGKYASAPFNVALSKSVTALTEGDAANADEDAQEILLTDLPALPLWNPTVQAVFGDDVEDVVLDWEGIPLYDQITKHD